MEMMSCSLLVHGRVNDSRDDADFRVTIPVLYFAARAFVRGHEKGHRPKLATNNELQVYRIVYQ
jgi:hypothetical protein